MTLAIHPGPLMRERTTLRLGGRALAEIKVFSAEGLLRLPKELARLGGAPFVLGRGSNVLARDGELPVVLVRPVMRSVGRGSGSWELVREDGNGVLVCVAAGTPLPGLVRSFCERGWSGMEGMAGIPGSLGGAVAMNAGSFGSETAQVLRKVHVFTPGRGLRWVGSADYETGYRRFRLKEQAEFFVVAAAELELARTKPEVTMARMRESMAKKKATQPIKAWSAGSAFKNPGPGVSAGRLLDEAGLRGFKLGGMAFSGMHANFLVNLGQGTADQALELIDLAKDKVREMSGHDLELEVRLCPCS